MHLRGDETTSAQVPSHVQRLKVASTGQVYESKSTFSKSKVPRWEKFVEGVSRAVSVRTAFSETAQIKGSRMRSPRYSSELQFQPDVVQVFGARVLRLIDTGSRPFVRAGPFESQARSFLSTGVGRLLHAATAPDIQEKFIWAARRR